MEHLVGSRLQAAGVVWNATDWNPTSSRTVYDNTCWTRTDCRGVWISGYDPANQFVYDPDVTILAYNRYVVTRRTLPNTGQPYDDISDWDVAFNTTAPGHPTFTYSASGSSDPNIYDFQGTLTHELGHGIFLEDLYGADCYSGATIHTMCGDVNGVESTQQRSLTSDDVAGANYTY